VVIYVNDHRPPHVYVIGPDAEARIALGDEGDKPRLMTNEGCLAGRWQRLLWRSAETAIS
jgi:hypothetical protein